MIIEGLIGVLVDYLEHKDFADVYVVEDRYSILKEDIEGMYVSLEDLKQMDSNCGEFYKTIVNIEYKLGSRVNIYEGYGVLDEVRRDISYSEFEYGDYVYTIKGVDSLRGTEGTLRSRLYVDIEREY